MCSNANSRLLTSDDPLGVTHSDELLGSRSTYDNASITPDSTLALHHHRLGASQSAFDVGVTKGGRAASLKPRNQGIGSASSRGVVVVARPPACWVAMPRPKVRSPPSIPA